MNEWAFILFLVALAGLFTWNVERALRTGVFKGRGPDVVRGAQPGAFQFNLWCNGLIAAALWLGALTLSVLRFT